jgi:hypothetical protein
MAGSAFAGIVVDRSDNVAAYYGEGAGLAAGSGASLAVQAGFSNGTGTHSISGPFADVGAGGGAGAAGGADYFGGWTDGQLVHGWQRQRWSRLGRIRVRSDNVHECRGPVMPIRFER